MRKIILLLILSTAVLSLCGNEQYKTESALGRAFEIPRLAFKLIADSTIDPCPICVKKTQKQAFSRLNRKFIPGEIIIGNELCGFMRTEECGPNEFVLSCYKKRETYISQKDKPAIQFPLLIFRFHSKTKYLIGISRNDFTMDKYASLIKNSSFGSLLKGKIQIINYKFGDGISYNYFRKKNQVQVQCKILELKGVDVIE